MVSLFGPFGIKHMFHIISCMKEQFIIFCTIFCFPVHDLGEASFENVNMSHIIRHMSFGQKLADRENPLDGVEFMAEDGKIHSLEFYCYCDQKC